MLHDYVERLRKIYRAHPTDAYHESIHTLEVFGPLARSMLSWLPSLWEDAVAAKPKRNAFRNLFNEFVLEIETFSRRIQV